MSGDPGNAGATNVRCLAIVVGSLVVLVGLAAACLGDTALAQGLHGGHSGHASPGQFELMTGIEHGCTLAATALLAGLAPFAALVWLPASREVGGGHDAIGPFGILAWMLFYVLAVSGVGELSAYAMRASGEPLGTELFREALFDTRVGAVWLARLGFGLLTAVAITAAARSGWASLWWAAAGIGSLLLMTLTQLSHAAAEGRFLPFLADWTHAMAAALWVGGLLGFVVALFSGPLGALAADRRAKLRERSVRRFSKVATAAVLVLASTGLYAILLHVPSPQALVATPYGRALLVKLGLLTFVLAIGSANFLLRGRGPFGHLVVVELLLALGLFVATGFLTSLPPANAVSQEAPAPPQTALEPTTPTGASGSVSGEERAAENEADCRLVTYVAQENMSEQEASVFSERLADMIREMEDPSLSAGSVRNAALDHFGVPRYAECTVGGE